MIVIFTWNLYTLSHLSGFENEDLTQQLKLDLSKLTGEEPLTAFYAVPHTEEQVAPLVS